METFQGERMKINDKVILSNIRAFAKRNSNQRICYIPETRSFFCQGDRYYVDPTPELIKIAELGYFYIFELEEK